MIRPYFRRHPIQARLLAASLIPLIPLIVVCHAAWESRSDIAREVRSHWRIARKGINA